MAAKWTDGEWKAEGLEVRVYGRGIVAECPVPQDGGVVDCNANAKLIAAAPDLYEAVNRLITAVRRMRESGVYAVTTDDLLSEGEDALARARGELT